MKTTKTVKAVKTTKTATPKKPIEPVASSKDSQLVKYEGQALDIVAKVKLLSVTNNKSLEMAVALLGNLSSMRKALETHRKSLTAPIREAEKRINEMFRPALAKLDSADDELRAKVTGWRREEAERAEAERREAERRAMESAQRAEELREAGKQKAARKAEERASEAAMEAVSVEAPLRVMEVGSAKVTTRQVWRWEVQDFGAVPKEYFSLDEKKLGAAVRSGVREIPGVRIWSEEQLAVGVGDGGGLLTNVSAELGPV